MNLWVKSILGDKSTWGCPTCKKTLSIREGIIVIFLTLSAHAREGYSSYFVCHSLTHSLTLFSILEKAPFLGLKLTSVYVLGDDLSALNVALF